MKHLAFAGIITAVILASAGQALAQRDLERFERQLEQIQRQTRMQVDQRIPAEQRTLFDYGGYFTLSYLSLDDQNSDNHVLRQYDLVLYANLNIDNVHQIYGSIRNSYRDFNDGDSFDGEGDEYECEIDRLYYRFDLARYYAAYKGETIDYNLIFTGGRQLVYWANGLTLSLVLDAAILELEYGPMELQLLGGITPMRTVDFDSSRPRFDDDTHRGFYGAMLTGNVGVHRPFLYALFQQDNNHDETLSLGIINTEFQYYSWYIGAGSQGAIGDRIVYGVEFVYEGGSTKSNSFEPDTFFPVQQTEDDISAWALDVQLNYLFPDIRRSRLGFEAIFASGDEDRVNTSNTFGGNQPNTTDTAFNAFGLLNTGLAFSPSVSNMMLFRLGGSTFPFPDHSRLSRLQIGADLFAFYKLDGDAPIDETTFDGSFLGWEPDIYLNWQITSDVTLVLRYGVFFPNSDVIVNDDARQFFYGGITFAF